MKTLLLVVLSLTAGAVLADPPATPAPPKCGAHGQSTCGPGSGPPYPPPRGGAVVIINLGAARG